MDTTAVANTSTNAPNLSTNDTQTRKYSFNPSTNVDDLALLDMFYEMVTRPAVTKKIDDELDNDAPTLNRKHIVVPAQNNTATNTSEESGAPKDRVVDIDLTKDKPGSTEDSKTAITTAEPETKTNSAGAKDTKVTKFDPDAHKSNFHKVMSQIGNGFIVAANGVKTAAQATAYGVSTAATVTLNGVKSAVSATASGVQAAWNEHQKSVVDRHRRELAAPYSIEDVIGVFNNNPFQHSDISFEKNEFKFVSNEVHETLEKEFLPLLKDMDTPEKLIANLIPFLRKMNPYMKDLQNSLRKMTENKKFLFLSDAVEGSIALYNQFSSYLYAIKNALDEKIGQTKNCELFSKNLVEPGYIVQASMCTRNSNELRQYNQIVGKYNTLSTAVNRRWHTFRPIEVKEKE